VDNALLAELAMVFAKLSLLAVGGINPLLPEMHRLVVGTYHWMSDAQFTTLFAITQGAPGPNVLVVAAIGWQVAGIPGAVVSLGAICLPSALLAGGVATLRERVAEATWARSIQQGLVPVTVGLVAASSLLLARGASETAASPYTSYLLAATALLVTIRHNPNPLWLLAAGAILGLTGVV
jgi:chromate transporter